MTDLRREHIRRVESVNNTTRAGDHHYRDVRLNSWRDGVRLAKGWDDAEWGRFLSTADHHYIDQGIDRPMCCGVWLDWEPA